MALFCQKDGGALINPDLPADPYAGKVLLDQFRIEKLVGQGGMGAVYRARQTTIGRDVAIKILHPELTTNPDAVRRFQREARVSAALDHPNVVRVFLFGQLPDDGSLYIVMQYLRGRSLLDVTDEDTPLAPSRALHIITQICDGVGEAHSQGVIHRDVKPENVILVQRGQDPDFVKVLDFGIARFIENEQTVATQSGLIFGTARYISPEGANGDPTDARSDVYSIGVLAYQLLTGHTPFEATSPVALLMKHINDPAPDIRGQPGGSALPPNICDVVMRCLTKNADGRYDDANDLAAALRSAAMMDRVVVAPPRISALPSRPSHPQSEPAPASSAALHGPTPITGPGPGQEGLTHAPSPFAESASVPGLGRARFGAMRTFVVWALVGAIAITLGAFATQAVIEAVMGGEDLDDLADQAQAAYLRGHFEKPVGESVLAITDRMLEIEPGHAGAIGLRRDVARRLREEGEVERAQGFYGEAMNRYRRALIFFPEDTESHRALAELHELEEAQVREEVEPELASVPSEPAVREPTTFTATLAEAPAEGAEPTFVVTRVNARGETTIEARQDGDVLRWVGGHTFRRAGAHVVTFHAGDTTLELEVEVLPRAQARAQRSRDRDDEPPTTVLHSIPSGGASANQAMATDDGIDWRLPEERQADMTTPSPTPTMTAGPLDVDDPARTLDERLPLGGRCSEVRVWGPIPNFRTPSRSEAVFALAQGGEGLDVVAAVRDLGDVEAEEGVGPLLGADGAWDGGPAALDELLGGFETSGDRAGLRLDGRGVPEVLHRVLVAAPDRGVVG